MEAIGILARSAADIAAVMAAAAGTDEMDFSVPEEEAPGFLNGSGQPRVRTLGWIRESVSLLERQEREAFLLALEGFARAGLTLVETSLKEFELFRVVHQIVGAVEASSAAGKYDGVRFGYRTPSAKNWNEMYLKTREEIFGPVVKPYLFQGAYYQFMKYGVFEKACRLRSHLMRESRRLFGEVDALAMPALRGGFDPCEAGSVPALYDAFLFTLPASLTGLPAVCIPTEDGSPLSGPAIQLIGPRLGDAGLLALAGEGLKNSTKES
jgi:aspartyl-tRNA(Asn)/glutamyl-tRNA(Gln) amidotransferase subunit A